MGLDSVELVLAVEGAFAITLSDAEVAEALAVGDLVELAWLKVRSRGDLHEDEVREIVHQHICHSIGAESCRDEDRLIEDLGMG